MTNASSADNRMSTVIGPNTTIGTPSGFVIGFTGSTSLTECNTNEEATTVSNHSSPRPHRRR
jgi:hypothetical protein